MSAQGAKPLKLDPEEAFGFWYADGQRRTYGQVAQRFRVHYNTVRKAADEHDWDGRADALDEKAREIADKRLAHLRAQATLRVAEVAMTGIVKFTQRLPEKIADPKDPSKQIPNPHALEPGELTSADLLRFVKMLEATGVIGSADGDAADELREGLESLRQQVAGMYELEADDGDWSEVDVDGSPARPALPVGDASVDAANQPGDGGSVGTEAVVLRSRVRVTERPQPVGAAVAGRCYRSMRSKSGMPAAS